MIKTIIEFFNKYLENNKLNGSEKNVKKEIADEIDTIGYIEDFYINKQFGGNIVFLLKPISY